MPGYYRMSRGWMDSSMFAAEPLCKRAAWIWLIENAAFAPRIVPIGGQSVALKRGQLVASVQVPLHTNIDLVIAKKRPTK